MAFEVEDLEATLADLRATGLTFERFEMPGFEVSGDTIAAILCPSGIEGWYQMDIECGGWPVVRGCGARAHSGGAPVSPGIPCP